MPRQGPSAAPSAVLLLGSVFVIAACGLVYELIAGALSSYLLGNATAQFSVVIGLFLSAMGLGSFLSRYVKQGLVRRFILVEIWVGVVGGLSPLLLFFTFAALGNYLPLLIVSCVTVGALVGLEIPLLVRILRREWPLEDALGNVLSIDYLGALAASLLFPFLLAPHLGLVRTGALFGMLNVAVAWIGIVAFKEQLQSVRRLQWFSGLALGVLLLSFAGAGRATWWLEDILYDDDIVFAEDTPYQRLVVTRWRNDVRLYLDGNIQFSSVDEFRYHEALVHPAMGSVAEPRRVLILGGGDGLAAREVFRHASVEKVDVVDLDPAVTELFRTQQLLTALNAGALSDPRLTVHNQDAYKFLEASEERYDVAIIDLPDPNNESLGKLYTRSFYRLVARHLEGHGVMVTQASSPFYTTAAFWCIVHTVEASSENTAARPLFALPYHVNVPSFGDWGFVMASRRTLSAAAVRLPAELRFLSEAQLQAALVFPADTARRPVPVNRISEPVLVELYLQGYKRYNN